MNDILKSWLISAFRHALSILAAYLIKRGWFDAATASDENLGIVAAGLAVGAISLGSMLYAKLRTHRLVNAALNAPSGADIETVKASAARQPLL